MAYAAQANVAYADEQNLALLIRNHLVTNCGWTQEDLITNIATDYDVVLRSVGEVPANNDDLLIRIRGNADNVQFYAYTAWDSGTNTGTNQLTVAGQTLIATGGGAGNFWITGDLDSFVVTEEHGGAYRTIYVGLLEHFYTSSQDTYPVCISSNLISNNWGTSGTASSTDAAAHYPATGTVAVSALNARLSVWCPDLDLGYQRRGAVTTLVLFPVTVLSIDIGGAEEIRGVLRGVYCCPATAVLASEDTVVIGADTYYAFDRTGTTYGRFLFQGKAP